MVQLRDKTASTRSMIEHARALLLLLRPLRIPLLINDRVDVALAVAADGVHVGQDDMPVELVRTLIGSEKIIGLSITSEDDLGRSGGESADYFGVGPVFAQSTKLDATAPLGLGGLAAVQRASSKPILAIGGIGPGNARAILACGVAGIAVVSAIMAADRPDQAARELATA